MKKDKNNMFDNLEALGIVDKFSKGLGGDKDIQSAGKTSYYVEKFVLNGGKSYFVKNSENIKGISSIASSKLCEKVGILTPPIYLLSDKNRREIKTLQQNVREIADYETLLASEDLEYLKIQKKPFGKFKWQMFYDDELMENLLKFMTPDCLIQFQNMYLIDELRTDIDRHTKNYFFYKTKDSKKYQGVIEIDLELMEIYHYCGAKKEDFTNFLVYPYETALPHQLYDKTNYMQRVSNIRQLIQDGVMTDENINAIIAALEYDFPAEMKKICRKKKIGLRETNEIVSPIERLWEYNRKTIGKDLEM